MAKKRKKSRTWKDWWLIYRNPKSRVHLYVIAQMELDHLANQKEYPNG